MAANITPQTIIIPAEDPALARAYPDTLQGTQTIGAGNTQVYVTNQITQQLITNLSGGGQAEGANGFVQYNIDNFLQASPSFKFNPNTKSLSIEGITFTGALNTDFIGYANGDPWVFGSGNGTVGGGNLTLQYNNAGNFGGVTGTSYNFITGKFTLGNIGNIKIGGGTASQVIITDGLGNLSFGPVVPPPSGVNTQVQFNDAGTLGGNANLTFNKTTGTLSTANVVASDTITSATVLADQIGNAASSVTGNVFTGTTGTFSGNVDTGNLSTGIIDATGAITSGAAITATGNVTGANLVTGGVANVTGNLSAGNITTTAITANGSANLINSPNVALGPVTNVHITGGSAGQYLQTDGAGGLSFTTVSLSNINNGTSNVSVLSSGNVGISSAGVANVVVVTSTGANITGTGNVTGNFSAGNITTVALTANGNIALSGTNVSLGVIGNLKVTGGSNGQAITTDGAGNLAFTTVVLSNISNGTSNVSVINNGNVGISAGGNANVVVVRPAGANVTGTLNVTGAMTLSNDLTMTGNLSVTNNVNFTGSNVTLGSNANVRITGGIANQFLQTDSTGTLSWANAIINASGANTQVQFNDATVANGMGATAGMVFNKATNTFTVGNTIASPNASFTGANVWLGGVGNVHITGGSANAATLGAITLNGSGNVTAIAIVSGGDGYDIPPTITVSGTNSLPASVTAVLTGGVVTGITIVSAGSGYISPTAAIASPGIKYLSTDGANNLSWREASGNGGGGGGGTVAGSSTTVQFNDGGVLAGSTGFTFNKTTNSVSAANNFIAGGNVTAVGNIVATIRIVGSNIEGNTANVNIANIATTLTLTGNLNATSAPNVTLGAVGNVHITGGLANQFLQTDGTGTLTWSNATQLINGTSNVSVAASGNVTAVAGGNTTLTVTGTGANIAGTGNVTGNFSAGNITTVALTANGNVDFTSSGNVSLGTVANIKIAGGSNTFILQTDGNSNVVWANINNLASRLSNGNSNIQITGNGDIAFTANAKANLLVLAGGSNANLSYANFQATIQTPVSIEAGGQVVASGNVLSNANVVVDASSGGGFVLANTSSGFEITIKPPAITSAYTLTLPATDGNVGQYLVTDGTGVTTWSNIVPAGANTQVQFNDDGNLGATGGFVFNKSTSLLSVGNLSVSVESNLTGAVTFGNTATGITGGTSSGTGYGTQSLLVASGGIGVTGASYNTGDFGIGGNLRVNGSFANISTLLNVNGTANVSTNVNVTGNTLTNNITVNALAQTANLVVTGVANIFTLNLTGSTITTGGAAAGNRISIQVNGVTYQLLAV